MKPHEEVNARLEAALSDYRKVASKLKDNERAAAMGVISTLRMELQDALTLDAVVCPTCGGRPHGMLQPWGIEIGCLGCRNTRSRGKTLEEATALWNEGKYGKRVLPPL